MSLVGRYLRAIEDRPDCIGSMNVGDFLLITDECGDGSGGYGEDRTYNRWGWCKGSVGRSWKLMDKGFNPSKSNIISIDTSGTIKGIKEISYFDTYYNQNYDIFDIPKTSNYDELCYILSHGLKEGIYNKLPGENCGTKAKNLLTEWGFINPIYEVY